MKIPTDLQPGDIFHTNTHIQYTFTGYATGMNETKWADTNVYSFRMEDGIAEPTDIEVIRIQRVHSSGVSEGMQRETDAMIRQERTTKVFIAIELQNILAQYVQYSRHDSADFHGLYKAIEAYKTRLFKEAEPS